MGEEVIGQGTSKVEIFDRNPESWNKIGTSVMPLVREILHTDEENPELTDTNYNLIFPSVKDSFLDPRSITTIMTTQAGSFMGFSHAIPNSLMFPQREETDVAYLFMSGLLKDYRNQGNIVGLTDRLLLELAKHGYKQVVRDAMIENGYADKLTKAYAELNFPVKSYDHTDWPEIGQLRRFTINIDEYLKLKNLA